MKTIQLSNLDASVENNDINIRLSGDLLIFPDNQRYRLSRHDTTRLLMFIEDLSRRYEMADRYGVDRYTGCQDHTGKEFDHIERNPK